MTLETGAASESVVDKRVRQFLELVEESSTAVLNNGFSRTRAETLGAAGRRPYSVRATFTRGEFVITTKLVLEFAGDENVTTEALRRDEVVFESSATAHKGQEIRKALTNHFECALVALGFQ